MHTGCTERQAGKNVPEGKQLTFANVVSLLNANRFVRLAFFECFLRFLYVEYSALETKRTSLKINTYEAAHKGKFARKNKIQAQTKRRVASPRGVPTRRFSLCSFVARRATPEKGYKS